ncbi:FbpB family small basic protein [Bacillus dakarensis]|nr:FbpB family small basic protein [Bacillus dakarensis]
MRDLRKKHNLVELVKSNKEDLLNDKKQLEKLEQRLEERRSLGSKKVNK